MDLGQQRRQPLVVISPMRPIAKLPDIDFIAAFHAVIVRSIHRRVNIFTALNAVFDGLKRREPGTIKE